MESQKEKTLQIFDLIIAADEVKPENINDFRLTLGPQGLELFERIDETRKRLLVVLDGLTHDQMFSMRNELGNYSILFHDINNLLMIYQFCVAEN